MDPIHSLLEWATSKGVSIRGIQPQTKTNCGIGMTATKNLKKGDVLLTVPTRAMRGLGTVPAAIRARLPQEMSIHGLLAADFVLNPPAESWIKVIPTIDEFNSIPFFWPPEAQRLLPGTVKRLLEKQQSNFGRDWKHLQSAYPHVPSEDYMHAWFVVSSRAFYQETQQTLLYPWHDRLAMLPVADLFNHASVGCKVSYCAESYDIVADREYGKGDEVCTCYGEHSNDFLLAEYGFLLQNNTNDRFDPDDLISSELSPEETALLKQSKTLAALDQLCVPATSDKGRVESTPGAIDNVRLQKLLAKFLEEIKGCRQNVLALDDGKEGYRQLLLQRWDQIDELVRRAIPLSLPSSGPEST